MANLNLVLVVIAFLLVLLAGLGVNAERVRLGWLGLAAYLLSILI